MTTPTPQPYGSPVPPQGQAYAPGAPSPQPYGGQPPKGRTGPLALLIAGIVVLIVAIICIVLGAINIVSSSNVTRYPMNTENTVTLEGGHSYGIYADGYLDGCRITDPRNADVDFTTSTSDVNVRNHELLATFDAASSGTYTIQCASDLESSYYVGPALDASGIAGMVVLIVVGGLLGFLGFALTISGIIWLVVRNKAIGQSHTGQMPMGGGSTTGYPSYPSHPGGAPTGYPSTPPTSGPQAPRP